MYILTEQIMNGSVTMNVSSTIVDAPDFQTAKELLKNLPTLQSPDKREISIHADDDQDFSFTISTISTEENDFSSGFSVYGHMKNEEAKVIRG